MNRLNVDALYLREAAGPYDHALIEDTEQAMAAAGFYRADQPQSRGTTVTYRLLAKAGEHNAELDAEAARPSDARGADLAINTRSAAESKKQVSLANCVSIRESA